MKHKLIAVLLALFLVFAPANLALADNDGEHGKSDKSNSQDKVYGYEKNDEKKNTPVGEKVDGPQGKSPSDPDGDENGGRDKPGGTGGTSPDKDGNNGSGNDDDCEDDNNGQGVPGHCKDKAKPTPTPTQSETPKPVDEKVTICHAAGKAGTTKYVTITISKNGLSGHFHNNGTPRAGHEEDYFGPCVSTPTTPTTPPTPTKPEEPKVDVPKPEKPGKPSKPEAPKPDKPKKDKPSKPVVTPTPDETETPVAVPGPKRPALAKTGSSNAVAIATAGVLALLVGALLFALSRLRRSE